MSKMLKNKNNIKTCRLCLKDEKFTLSIFSDYGKKLNIKSNMENYLKISIREDDSLPKYICFTCLSHLNFVIKFINLSKSNQNTFKKEDGQHNYDSLFDDDSESATPPKFTKKTVDDKLLKRRINENFKPIAKRLCAEEPKNYGLCKNNTSLPTKPDVKPKNNGLFRNNTSLPTMPDVKTTTDINKKISELNINNNNDFKCKEKNVDRKKVLSDLFKQKCNTLKNSK